MVNFGFDPNRFILQMHNLYRTRSIFVTNLLKRNLGKNRVKNTWGNCVWGSERLTY